MLRNVAIVMASFGFVSCDRSADNSAAALTSLQNTLQGTWRGEGPCDGEITLRAGGAYERSHYSPGGFHSVGNWRLRWDGLPPVLVLNCKTSDDSDEVGKSSELKLIQLSRAALECQYPGGSSVRYTRVGP